MNKYFPLTPKMWQEWAKDEISLSTSDESFGHIEKLYERGVQEYLSIKLWRDYLDYVEEHDQSVSQCSPSGLSKMRDLFERAITAGGLHVTEGSKLWAAYREYEMAILITLTDGNDEEKAKQVQRIRTLFHRQLSVPLADMESTLAEYKSWEAEQGHANDPGSDFDGVPSNVVSAYKKANDMYNARKQYEDQLINAGSSEAVKLQEFLKYIKFEESCGDPARVQVLYERAVSELPVSSDLWMQYTSYLDMTLKVPSVLRSVYHRATRNCTWVGELWVRYLLSLERIRATEEELQHVFERAVQCSFPTIKEYLDVYLTRVDGLRRRMSDGLDFQLIRQTFMDASEFLSPQLGTEELLLLHAYWAKLERNVGKDLAAARGVWENTLKKSGSVLEIWQHYISMEIELGHIHEARTLYKRCYSKRFPGSGSEDVCHAWIRFEREHGTLEDYDLACSRAQSGGGSRRRAKRRRCVQSECGASLDSGCSSSARPIARLPLQSPFKPMDHPISQSDGGEDFDACAVYELYSSQFASQGWWNEVGPVEESPSQGAQSGAGVHAAEADGLSSVPPCNTSAPAGATTSKNVPRRTLNYSKQQDLVLCSAYLNVSRDPIVGTNQSGNHYWSRIHSYFQEHQNGPSRSKESLQHRWHTIQKDTSRFCGFKAEQDRLNRSGKTQQDWVTDAQKAFLAAVGHEFQFMHCWEVLCNENKWHCLMQGGVERSRRVRRDPGPLFDDADPEAVSARPIGRDAAKKRRSETGSASTDSACLEVLQRSTMSKEKQSEEVVAAKADLLSFEQEKVAVKKEMLLLMQKTEQEKLDFARQTEHIKVAIDKQRLELEQARLEEDRRQREEEAEERIMLLDVSQLSPVEKSYWMARKQQILNRVLCSAVLPLPALAATCSPKCS